MNSNTLAAGCQLSTFLPAHLPAVDEGGGRQRGNSADRSGGETSARIVRSESVLFRRCYHPFKSVGLLMTTKVFRPRPYHAAPAAEDFAAHLCETHERLKSGQDSQARYYDGQHGRVEFQPGDMVWLNASNIATSRPSKKLNWRRLRRYKVVKRIGLQAYQLALPPTMRQLHNVFHVSCLDPIRPTSLAPRLPPAPPAHVIDDQGYFEIEDILDSKRDDDRPFGRVLWIYGFAS
jgi:hypothetical protein